MTSVEMKRMRIMTKESIDELINNMEADNPTNCIELLDALLRFPVIPSVRLWPKVDGRYIEDYASFNFVIRKYNEAFEDEVIDTYNLIICIRALEYLIQMSVA